MAYRDSTTNEGSAGDPSTAVPAGVAADDIVILVLSLDGGGALPSWPASFTELVNVYPFTLDGQRIGIGWKRLTGADSGSYTFGTDGAGRKWIAQAFAFSGRHTTDPPTVSSDSVSDAANSSPITVTANGVTAVDGDDIVFVSAPDVHSGAGGDGHSSWSAGYTEREDAEHSGGWVNLAGATAEAVSAGATGSKTVTFTLSASTSGWAAWLVRIPAAAGGTTRGTPFETRGTAFNGGRTLRGPLHAPARLLWLEARRLAQRDRELRRVA